MDEVDISKCDKPALLIALYEHARPLGMGFLRATNKPLTREMAEEMLEGQTYFDYVAGRPLKVDLKGPLMKTWLYDRDQGEGQAARIVGEVLEVQS